MMELAYILVSNTRFFGFESRYRYYREHGVMVAHYIRVVGAEFESHVFVLTKNNKKGDGFMKSDKCDKQNKKT